MIITLMRIYADFRDEGMLDRAIAKGWITAEEKNNIIKNV